MADTYLSESPVWVTPIYLLDPDDPLMGGEFGWDNIQPRQIACRTQYLRELLTREHTVTEGEDGAAPTLSHTLGASALSQKVYTEQSAKIKETKLALSPSISELLAELEANEERIAALSALIDEYRGASGTSVGAIYEAIRLSWLYGSDRYGFELFNSTYTMMDTTFAPYELIAAKQGDDSIDLKDPQSLKQHIGERYILTGRVHYDGDFALSDLPWYTKTVYVAQVLHGTRVLLSEDFDYTSYHGTLGKYSFEYEADRDDSDWPDGAYFRPGAAYITKEQHTLDSCGSGIVYICCELPTNPDGSLLRDENDALVIPFTVEAVSGSIRTPAVPVINEADLEATRDIFTGLYRIPYQVMGGTISLYIENTCDQPIHVDHIAMLEDVTARMTSPIRTPMASSNPAAMNAMRYGCLYQIPPASAEFTCYFNGVKFTFSYDLSQRNSGTALNDDSPTWEFLSDPGFPDALLDAYTDAYNARYVEEGEEEHTNLTIAASSGNTMQWQVRYVNVEGEGSALSTPCQFSGTIQRS